MTIINWKARHIWTLIAFPWSHTFSSLSRRTLLHSVIDSSGLQDSDDELWCLFNRNPAKLADVWCLGLCAGTVFVLLLKFGAVMSIICGFLIAVSSWRRILQCIDIVRSFLRLIKLRKLAVGKLDPSRGGSLYSVKTWRVQTLHTVRVNQEFLLRGRNIRSGKKTKVMTEVTVHSSSSSFE